MVGISNVLANFVASRKPNTMGWGGQKFKQYFNVKSKDYKTLYIFKIHPAIKKLLQSVLPKSDIFYYEPTSFSQEDPF